MTPTPLQSKNGLDQLRMLGESSSTVLARLLDYYPPLDNHGEPKEANEPPGEPNQANQQRQRKKATATKEESQTSSQMDQAKRRPWEGQGRLSRSRRKRTRKRKEGRNWTTKQRRDARHGNHDQCLKEWKAKRAEARKQTLQQTSPEDNTEEDKEEDKEGKSTRSKRKAHAKSLKKCRDIYGERVDTILKENHLTQDSFSDKYFNPKAYIPKDDNRTKSGCKKMTNQSTRAKPENPYTAVRKMTLQTACRIGTKAPQASFELTERRTLVLKNSRPWPMICIALHQFSCLGKLYLTHLLEQGLPIPAFDLSFWRAMHWWFQRGDEP